MSQQAGPVPPGERRRAPRFSVCVPMEYEDCSMAGHGFTRNVSISGALIGDASSPPPLGANLRLRFSFFLGSFETLFRANVVRYADEGFAVQFDGLDEAQLGVLRTALPPGPYA